MNGSSLPPLRQGVSFTQENTGLGWAEHVGDSWPWSRKARVSLGSAAPRLLPGSKTPSRFLWKEKLK